MNIYECKQFFDTLYEGKKITFEFDDKCHRFYELVFTDGIPNQNHHIENQKVKVTVEGMPSIYVPIIPHRENVEWSYIKELINRKPDAQ